MEKITMKDFEERIALDEALAAKAKEITGAGDDLKEKISAFAASLGYELDLMAEPKELSDKEMENVSGGRCRGHEWKLVSRVKGLFWGYNAVYRCNYCGNDKFVWE